MMMLKGEQRRKHAITEEEARERAAAVCVRCETCEWELRTKFDRWGLDRAQADRVIAFLYEDKFIDDQRFARAFTNDKIRFSGWGKLKVSLELRRRRIASDAIRDALDGVDPEEYAETLYRVARSKMEGLDMNEYNDRAKLYRRIMTRGFESGAVSRVVARIRKEHADDR